MNESEFKAEVDEQTNADWADMLANTKGAYRDCTPDELDNMREAFKVGWAYAWFRLKNGEPYRAPQRTKG